MGRNLLNNEVQISMLKTHLYRDAQAIKKLNGVQIHLLKISSFIQLFPCVIVFDVAGHHNCVNVAATEAKHIKRSSDH